MAFPPFLFFFPSCNYFPKLPSFALNLNPFVDVCFIKWGNTEHSCSVQAQRKTTGGNWVRHFLHTDDTLQNTQLLELCHGDLDSQLSTCYDFHIFS